MTTIDLFAFLTSFRVSAPQGILMATYLDQRADKEPPDAVKRALERMRQVCSVLDEEYAGRRAAKKVPKVRDSLAALANAWRSVGSRLESWTTLPGAPAADAEEAQRILNEVVPDGYDFLVGDPGEQWLESKTRLAALNSETNKEGATRLAGAPFVAALRKAHRALGVELGLEGGVTSERDEQDYRPMVKELISAIRDYALQVCAVARDTSPSDMAHAAFLLEPIETQRMRPTSDTSVDDGEGDQPVPAPAPHDAVRDATPANDAAHPPASERRVA